MNASASAPEGQVTTRRGDPTAFNAGPTLALVAALVIIATAFWALHVSILVAGLVQFAVALAVAAYWRITNRNGWLILAAVAVIAGINTLPIGGWRLPAQVLVVVVFALYARRLRRNSPTKAVPAEGQATNGPVGGGGN